MKMAECIQIGQLEGSFESTGRVYSAHGLCPTINTMGGGDRQPKILIPQATKDGYIVRKLTPKECWRLMGFTDEDFLKAQTALNNTFYKGEDKSSSQLYKVAGNSIVVNVLMAIFGTMTHSP